MIDIANKTRSYVAIFAAMRGNPAIGGAGVDTKQEAAFMASHYRHYRRRGMTVARALDAARNLPATYIHGCEYYGTTDKAGEPSDNGLRWIENTSAMGFRFIGDACDLLSGRRDIPIGYYTDAHGDYQTLRAGVWQLPGKGRHARLVIGYREFDGREETNAGSARIDCRYVLQAEMDSYGDLAGHDDTLEAARTAASLAEHAAETEREYNIAYEAGREAAEIDAAMIAARQTVLPLIRELKAATRLPMARDAFPHACAALRARIDSMIETISEAREKRESAWGKVWRDVDIEPWLAGFMDESSFVRAVRLGYAKASDWKGKPEDNPCNA